MYLLAIVRWVLGRLFGAPSVLRSVQAAKSWAVNRCRPAETNRPARFPHQWMYMDYDLTSVTLGCHRQPSAFAKNAHPLLSMFRRLRRLAGLPEPYPALVATVSADPRRHVRER